MRREPDDIERIHLAACALLDRLMTAVFIARFHLTVPVIRAKPPMEPIVDDRSAPRLPTDYHDDLRTAEFWGDELAGMWR